MSYHSYQPTGATLVVSVEGRLDAETAAQLTAGWEDSTRFVNLVVDLSQVTVLESAGLAVLVSGLSLTRARGGDLIVAAPSEGAVTVLTLTGLDHAITVAPSITDALARLAAP